VDARRRQIARRCCRSLLRRQTCRPLVILGAALSLAFSSPASAAVEPAKPADSFVDSIGVNTHTSYSDTVYASRFGEVKQKLVELGVRHIREGLEPNRPDQYEQLAELAGVGVKSTLILGDPDIGASGLEGLISTLRNRVRDAAEAIEGPNEFDMRGGPDWAGRLANYQRRLYDAIKADPALASLPVVGPSMVQRRNQVALGDISGALDYGNFHPYPDAHAPESNLSSQLERAATNSGSKPVMATETGYHTALSWSGEHNPASEAAMATYMPRLFLEYFRRGVARTFSYELLDEWPDPDHADRESNFGLLRNDLSEKPAFAALRNTIEILADPGPAFAPATLDYTVGGNRADLRKVLLQKRDGSFYLALWRSSSVWDPVNRAPLNAPSAPVTLDFEDGVKSAQRYMPNVSQGPIASLSNGGNRPLVVNVGAQVVILRLELDAPAEDRIRFWVAKSSVPAGGRVAVGGRLPSQAVGQPLRVNIQRWLSGAQQWRTVGRGRTSRQGSFRKALRLSPTRFGHVSKLRVIARKARPSRPVRVRIRRSASAPHLAVAKGRSLQPQPGPGAAG
jgi:hypothetical protein